MNYSVVLDFDNCLIYQTKLLCFSDQTSVLMTNVTEGVNVLTIDSVTTSHSGLYTCVASQVISDKEENISVTKVRFQFSLRSCIKYILYCVSDEMYFKIIKDKTSKLSVPLIIIVFYS